MTNMDDYLFEANVSRCKHVTELTTYLEIFSYSVSSSYQNAGPSTYKSRTHRITQLRSTRLPQMSSTTISIEG
jgi:hypothetical protein